MGADAIDYDALKAGLAAAVPYNRHLGLEIRSLGPGLAEVVLPGEDHLKNHLGTQHAGGLFSVGEAASGAAFVAAFSDRVAELAPVVTKAEIAFTRPGRGPILARAELGEPLEDIRERLAADGRAEFAVAVSLRDEDDEEVSRLSVTWLVRERR